MEFSKISAPTLKELFVQELEHMILSGRLAVGDKLPPERDLAQSMQVSRAVVNAGICELARLGFLTIRPRIGTFVADYRRNGTTETLVSIMNYNGGRLREDEIRSILELRIAMDSMAVKLCIPRITETELDSLGNYVTQLEKTTSMSEAAELAFSFQHELAFLSGNTLMPLIFFSFRAPILSLWERFCLLYGIETLYQNTSILYHLIRQRDTEKAISFLTEIIQDTINGDHPVYY